MRFLIDAQLPLRLPVRLKAVGHEAVHTREPPRGNRTTDEQLLAVAERETCVVVTKDGDFAGRSIYVANRASSWSLRQATRRTMTCSA